MVIPLPHPAALVLFIALPLLLFLGISHLIARSGLRIPHLADAALRHQGAPFVAGLITVALTLFVWRTPVEPPAIHDEQAYLLQAGIFATGHWYGQPPPLPEFFEQIHVFVTPRLASKYPPAHSALLVPGIWLGVPGLMPLILAGLSGTLVFAVSRGIEDPVVAVVAWATWATSSSGLWWRASYLSQGTSGVLWLLALWALLQWHAGGSRRALIGAAAAMGALYLTRPLTALALCLPLTVVVAMKARKEHRWLDVAVAASMLIPTLVVQAWWQYETLGNWLTSPYAEYSRQYFPFIRPGFGVDLAEPARLVPPDIAWVAQQFLPLHEMHHPLALPLILLARVIGLALAVGQDWRAFLLVLFVLGARGASGTLKTGIVSAAAVILAYLSYAHPAQWTGYYLEVLPVFFLVGARGMLHVAREIAKLDLAQARTACLCGVIVMGPLMATDVLAARNAHDDLVRFQRTAWRVLDGIDGEAVVFVRYPPEHIHHHSIVVNSPDYRLARLWLVRDRGADNERLLRLTHRAAYRLNVDDWSLERLR